VRQTATKFMRKALAALAQTPAAPGESADRTDWAEERAYWSSRFTQTSGERYGLEMHPIQGDNSTAPPMDLVSQIQNPQKANADVFFATDLRTVHTHLLELGEHGFDPRGFERIMEMGVDLGRLIRHYFPFSTELFGCDVTDAVLGFVERSLGPRVSIAGNGSRPPLPFRTGVFDFVYANSVFTHIRFGETPVWFEEIHRVVRPGGCVIVSVFNPDVHLTHLSPRDFDRQVTKNGYLEWGRDETILENYVFLNYDVLFDLWSRSFRVLELRQHFKEQDHLILKKVV